MYEELARHVDSGGLVVLDTERCDFYDVWFGTPLDPKLPRRETITVGNVGYLDLLLSLGRLRRELKHHLDRALDTAYIRLFGHDDECESEFIEGPMLMSPCGCGDRARYPRRYITCELSLDTSAFDAAIAKVRDVIA